jgi:hypothetical protein
LVDGNLGNIEEDQIAALALALVARAVDYETATVAIKLFHSPGPSTAWGLGAQKTKAVLNLATLAEPFLSAELKDWEAELTADW